MENGGKRVNGINLSRAEKTWIDGNSLYATYQFYIDNKEYIKPYARWQRNKKCWVFRDMEALLKIEDALKKGGLSESMEETKKEQTNTFLENMLERNDYGLGEEWIEDVENEEKEELVELLRRRKDEIQNGFAGLEFEIKEELSHSIVYYIKNLKEAKEKLKEGDITNFCRCIETLGRNIGSLRTMASERNFKNEIPTKNYKELHFLAGFLQFESELHIEKLKEILKKT